MKIKPVQLGKRRVGPGEPVFVICEGGVTHYGEYKNAQKQIDVAVNAKADSVKFQAWKTENLVSKVVAKRLEPKLGYNWFDRLKYKELSDNELITLQRYAASKHMPFFVTPHDEESIGFLDKVLNVPYFKVGSGESHNYEFLKKVGACRKPVVISFGLQSDSEAKKAIKTLRQAGARGIVALHCVTAYPTPYEMATLQRIPHLRKILGVPVGLSDQTAGSHVALAAIALGAVAIEKHLTFDKSDPRSLDNPGALLPDEFVKFVKEIREVEQALTPVPESKRMKFLEKSRAWAGQAIVARNDIKQGTVITRSMLALKRPFLGGLGAEFLPKIVGKKAKRHIGADEQLQLAQLQ